MRPSRSSASTTEYNELYLSRTDSCLPRSRITDTISYGCIARSYSSAITANASGFDTFLFDATVLLYSRKRLVKNDYNFMQGVCQESTRATTFESAAAVFRTSRLPTPGSQATPPPRRGRRRPPRRRTAPSPPCPRCDWTGRRGPMHHHGEAGPIVYYPGALDDLFRDFFRSQEVVAAAGYLKIRSAGGGGDERDGGAVAVVHD